MDNRRKGVIVASVIAAAVAIALAAALYQNNRPPGNSPPVGPGSNVSGGNGTGPPAQHKEPISVLASPSSLPFMEKWMAQYNNGNHAATVRVDYTGEVDHINIGPVYANVSDFLGRHLADMAIAGLPAQQGSNLTSAGSQFLPVSPQAVAVVYNVPGFPDVPSGLKLDPPTLARILGGNITRWDDSAIKGLNPGMSLPGEKIVVVHERRADSATFLLSKYLSNETAWPQNSQAADSADSLSAIVRQTPYSIGYVDFSYAVQTRMTYAALQNSGGEFMTPSADSIGVAVRNGTVTAGEQPPLTSVGRLGAGSYPIVGFYYAAFDPVTATPGKAAAVLDFVRWVAGKEGQQVLADMQYPSIYQQNGALGAMAGSLSNGTAMQNATGFGNATNLTKTSGDSVYGQAAAEGDSVYVAWQESTDDPPNNNEIFFMRSLDGGVTFGNATNLSKNDGISEHPQLAMAGNNLYLAWTDDSSETREVLFAKSADGGAIFGEAASLSDPNRESYNSEVATFKGSVYVVWQEQDADGNNAVLLRASRDSGETFGDPVEIASGSLVDPESYPKVAAYGGAVHVAWSTAEEKQRVYYARSADGGATFSNATALNGREKAGETQVAAYGSDVYVAWGGLDVPTVDMLMYSKSADGGKSFAPPAIIKGPPYPLNPELAIVPGAGGQYSILVTAQVSASKANDEIMLASSTDGGQTFSGATNLSSDPALSQCPSISASGGRVFVTWEDLSTGNHEIFMAKGKTVPSL